jgi:thioredoxin reductase (NADPH)
LRQRPSDKESKPTDEEWSIPGDARRALPEMFEDLKEDVVLEVFTKKGENGPYNELTSKFTADLARLSTRIHVHFNRIGNKKAQHHSVTASPTVLINPEKYRIRFTGAPAGEEGVSFIEAIMMVSREESGLSDKSRNILFALHEKRQVQVFATPACPYCPRQVLNGFRAAIERPGLVSAECIDSGENAALADALYIKSLGGDATIAYRRDRFRAEKYLAGVCGEAEDTSHLECSC